MFSPAWRPLNTALNNDSSKIEYACAILLQLEHSSWTYWSWCSMRRRPSCTSWKDTMSPAAKTSVRASNSALTTTPARFSSISKPASLARSTRGSIPIATMTWSTGSFSSLSKAKMTLLSSPAVTDLILLLVLTSTPTSKEIVYDQQPYRDCHDLSKSLRFFTREVVHFVRYEGNTLAMLPSIRWWGHRYQIIVCMTLTFGEHLSDLDVLLFGYQSFSVSIWTRLYTGIKKFSSFTSLSESNSQLGSQETATDYGNVGTILGDLVKFLKVLDSSIGGYVCNISSLRKQLGLATSCKQDLIYNIDSCSSRDAMLWKLPLTTIPCCNKWRCRQPRWQCGPQHWGGRPCCLEATWSWRFASRSRRHPWWARIQKCPDR